MSVVKLGVSGMLRRSFSSDRGAVLGEECESYIIIVTDKFKHQTVFSQTKMTNNNLFLYQLLLKRLFTMVMTKLSKWRRGLKVISREKINMVILTHIDKHSLKNNQLKYKSSVSKFCRSLVLRRRMWSSVKEHIIDRSRCKMMIYQNVKELPLLTRKSSDHM